jgi:hypothetical protein
MVENSELKYTGSLPIPSTNNTCYKNRHCGSMITDKIDNNSQATGINPTCSDICSEIYETPIDSSIMNHHYEPRLLFSETDCSTHCARSQHDTAEFIKRHQLVHTGVKPYYIVM